MSKKQNNDDVKNANLMQGSSKPQGKIDQPQSQNELQTLTQQQSLSSAQFSKRHSQLSSGKRSSKQSQLPNPTSNLSLSPQTLLPISIHELQQKPLNLYLKQFMQINSFQTIQKGKQLIELVKQAPGSKQTASVIGKSFKLFKSNIPDAVLCSFQFFRELIEVGHWRITDAVEQLLLTSMVEIVEYRAYMPQIQRGNTYFLNQIHRYAQDDKTNHLAKISSTFFRMVHEVLYVWGMHYFPESNFSKMLNRLMISKKIKFPEFPHQFRFYSQPRVQLYKNLIEKNKNIHLKQELEFKAKKAPQQPKNIAKDQQVQRNDVRNIGQKQISPNKKNNKLAVLNNQSGNVNPVLASIIDKKPLSVKEIEQNKQVPSQKSNHGNPKTQATKQPITQPKPQQIPNKKTYRSELELQNIVLKHQIIKQHQQLHSQQNKIASPSKSVQGYKRIKPSKIKSKKSTLSMGQSQKSIQLEKSKVQSMADADNVLELIQQIQNIQIYETKQRNYGVDSPKSVQNKKAITKQVIKDEPLKQKNQRSQSVVIATDQVQLKVNKIDAQQTFRVIQKPSISPKGEQTDSIRNQNDQQPNTVRMMSSERQRYIQFVSEESREPKNFHDQKKKTNQQQNLYIYDTRIKEFLKNQIQNIKTLIIGGIKDDIVRIVDQKVAFSQNALHINQNRQVKHFHQSQEKNQKNEQKSEQQILSARFGENLPQNKADPSVQAFEFIKKKLKKPKASSKLKRPRILVDEELKLSHQNPNQIQTNQKMIQPKSPLPKTVVDLGVNTQGVMQQQILDEISSLKQKLNIMTAFLSKPNPLSVKRTNNFMVSPNTQNPFFKTPKTINKNQQLHNINDNSINQISSLKTTMNTPRKKSKSKLSERRSSVQVVLLQKVLSVPESYGYLLQEVFGGPRTLLFNAAVNSLQKKRKSVMFC